MLCVHDHYVMVVVVQLRVDCYCNTELGLAGRGSYWSGGVLITRVHCGGELHPVL